MRQKERPGKKKASKQERKARLEESTKEEAGRVSGLK